MYMQTHIHESVTLLNNLWILFLFQMISGRLISYFYVFFTNIIYIFISYTVLLNDTRRISVYFVMIPQACLISGLVDHHFIWWLTSQSILRF